MRLVYGNYQKGSGTLKSEDRKSFFATADKDFRRVLTAVTNCSPLRLRMLDELGAIQRELGKPDESRAIYVKMAACATNTADAFSQFVAYENLFDLAKGDAPAELTNAAAQLEAAGRKLIGESDASYMRSKYCDALMLMGTTLKTRGSEAEGQDAVTLLGQAATSFSNSLAFPEGTSPMAVRMRHLAQAELRMGNRARAAEVYESIAAMKQDSYSKLMLGFERIGVLYDPASPQYREGLEQILAEHDSSGQPDEYEVTVRHQLGLSYQLAKQYAKSTAALNPILGRSKNKDVNAYNMYLVALNHLNEGDRATAKTLFQGVAKEYGHNGSGRLAEKMLVDVAEEENRAAQTAIAAKRRKVALAVFLLVGTIPFVVSFLMKKAKSRQRLSPA